MQRHSNSPLQNSIKLETKTKYKRLLTRSRPIGLGESIPLVVSQLLVPAQERTQDHGPLTCGGQHSMPVRVGYD